MRNGSTYTEIRTFPPGLVHVISAMEAGPTYKPWHSKETHRTFLRPATGKCLHYYFYFIDAELGLIYLRVPTWCPFRLQFYCNGHSWLARQLTTAGIGFTLADNAFLRIDDWQRAQTLANRLSPDVLRRVLDRYAQQCCPVLDVFALPQEPAPAKAGVEHRQGPATRALAPLRKTIYSLKDLREILLSCNRRYLEYLSSLDDFSAGIRALDRLTQPRPLKGRNLKGLNFFSRAEQTLLAALQRPGFNIAGLRRADLLPLPGQSSPATLSRQLARLRHLGVIKRVLGTYRYYLTRAGRAAIAAGRRLTEHTIITALA